jgi:hypothetical protein
MLAAARTVCVALAGIMLCACASVLVQGEGGPQLPARPVNRLVAYVAGPDSLVASFQAYIAVEAAKRGTAADNALLLFPPTHAYAETEIRQGLAARSIDGVLIVNVGDAGVRRQYAGTIFQARSAVSPPAIASTVASVNGDPRQTTFSAELLDAATGRRLWDGDGQIASGGFSFFENGTTVADSVAALFEDLQEKGIVGPAN